VVAINAVVQITGTNRPSIVSKQFNFGSGEFEAEVPVLVTGRNGNVTLSGSGLLELDTITWHVKPKPPGALPTGNK
jgi:hypothetical protein